MTIPELGTIAAPRAGAGSWILTSNRTREVGMNALKNAGCLYQLGVHYPDFDREIGEILQAPAPEAAETPQPRKSYAFVQKLRTEDLFTNGPGRGRDHRTGRNA